MSAERELKKPCHNFLIAAPGYVDSSTVEPSAVCAGNEVLANAASNIADKAVRTVMSMRKTTTPTNRRETGLVFASATYGSDFPRVQVYNGGSERVPCGVPHYPQHSLGPSNKGVFQLDFGPNWCSNPSRPLVLP